MPVELLSAAEMNGDTDYVARARTLTPLIAEAASDVEAGRRLDDAVVAALHEAGLFRMMMPRWLGGGEAPPSVFARSSRRSPGPTRAPPGACARWTSARSPRSISTARSRRRCSARKGSALAWGSTPDAKAVAVPGGYRVTGRWEFGSGCHHATWLGGHIPVIEPDGTPRPRTTTASRSTARCCSRNLRRASPMYGMCSGCAAPAATNTRWRTISSRRSTRSRRCSAGPTRRG